MSIAVFNRQRKIRFDLRRVKQIANCALREEHVAETAAPGSAFSRLESIEVTIVSDGKIAAIHEQFMRIPGATDVITFEHGEIVISAETALKNAERFSQPVEHELALYIIHGLLHLRGYNDQNPSDAARMRDLQERVLKKCLETIP